ncbi:MAG: zinc-ribbon domain-containing protein [Gemmatimonadaceae bacterium]
MTVACPDCRSVFRVDPAKVPASGVRARCSVCGGVIAITGGTLPVMVTPASAGVVQSAFTTPVEPSAPVAPPPMSAPRPARPSGPAIAAVAARVPTPSVARPVPPAPMTPSAPTSFVRTAGGATATQAPPAPIGTSAPTPARAAGTVASETPRRPINPFLKADPGQRARRLARALVSDLVAYHPQKRDEGIANGTLRQLFREEIKKSYEEFVDQVGRELAESSPHFQEALNEILGGGRKLF